MYIKGRVGRLSRRPSGHGGCNVPKNRWTNAGGSIDGHLPIAWRVPYKRVYPRSKTGDAINASIPMHGEGCIPQVAALRMSLRVPVRNESPSEYGKGRQGKEPLLEHKTTQQRQASRTSWRNQAHRWAWLGKVCLSIW